MSTSKGSGRTRRKFTPEFKAEVVAMVEASGGKIAQVAREMRLHDSSVGNWVREAREAKTGQAPTAAERAEIRELRAELERVTRDVTSWEKQSPTSRRRTRRTCDRRVHVHRRGAG
jgi:transposase-like protein